jgi:polygalacturonase
MMSSFKGKLAITDFGARPGAHSDCTGALQAAVDFAAGDIGATGGGVRIPQGEWTCGSILLRSGVHLHFEEGAVLRASSDAGLYPYFAHPVASRMDVFPRRALFFGHGLRDLSFTGSGTIEAGGQHEIFQDGVGDSPDRPYGLHLIDCENVRVNDLTWRNSAYWMMRYFQCRDVKLKSLTIFNHCNLNNDGIDIDSSEDVEIDDCRVDASDDGIVIKSESHHPSRRVRVRNCVVSSHASALKLGTASIGGFEDILFEDCEIRPSESREMHHVFGYWKGMTGLDVAQVDGGCARDITFRRIRMSGVANPIFVRLGNRHSTISIPRNRRREDARPALAAVGPGHLKILVFEDIEAVDVGPFPAVFAGYEGNPIRNIQLRNFKIAARKWKPSEGWNQVPDWNPSAYPCVHLLAAGGSLPASGILFRHTEPASTKNIELHIDPSDPRQKVHSDSSPAATL